MLTNFNSTNGFVFNTVNEGIAQTNGSDPQKNYAIQYRDYHTSSQQQQSSVSQGFLLNGLSL